MRGYLHRNLVKSVLKESVVETRGQQYLVRDKDFTIERGKENDSAESRFVNEMDAKDKLNRIESKEKIVGI